MSVEGDKRPGGGVGVPVDPKLSTRGYMLTAPVELPSQEQMTVKLAPINQLNHFDQTRSDFDVALAFGSLLAGAALGIVVNWTTADTPVITRASVIILVAFAVITLMVACLALRFFLRANEIKKDILKAGVEAPVDFQLLRRDETAQTVQPKTEDVSRQT